MVNFFFTRMFKRTSWFLCWGSVWRCRFHLPAGPGPCPYRHLHLHTDPQQKEASIKKNLGFHNELAGHSGQSSTVKAWASNQVVVLLAVWAGEDRVCIYRVGTVCVCIYRVGTVCVCVYIPCGDSGGSCHNKEWNGYNRCLSLSIGHAHFLTWPSWKNRMQKCPFTPMLKQCHFKEPK